MARHACRASSIISRRLRSTQLPPICRRCRRLKNAERKIQGETPMTRAQVSTIALIALLTTLPAPAHAGDVILSGTVTSAVGEKMGGVTVSAKAEGQTITTSVFTDEAGGYYFPPLTSGKYRVWAQALSYETAKSTIDLSAECSSPRRISFRNCQATSCWLRYRVT